MESEDIRPKQGVGGGYQKRGCPEGQPLDEQNKLLLSRSEPLVDLIPVNNVPPGRQIVRPSVLVLEVVGMLPDVIAQDRVQTLRERVVLVRCRDDLQLAAIEHQPAPARAELLRRRLVEQLLEVRERSEGCLGLVGDRARRVSAAAWLHDLPEHRAVDVTAAL